MVCMPVRIAHLDVTNRDASLSTLATPASKTQGASAREHANAFRTSYGDIAASRQEPPISTSNLGRKLESSLSPVLRPSDGGLCLTHFQQNRTLIGNETTPVRFARPPLNKASYSVGSGDFQGRPQEGPQCLIVKSQRHQTPADQFSGWKHSEPLGRVSAIFEYVLKCQR